MFVLKIVCYWNKGTILFYIPDGDGRIIQKGFQMHTCLKGLNQGSQT
jgi:hypothetical protein